MSKKSRLREPFHKQHGKHAERLLKSAWHTFSLLNDHYLTQLSCKKYLFLTCQILGLLVNVLADDEKYPLVRTDNLTIPIQMHLRKKGNTFCQFFTAFLKCSWNFENFNKKDHAHRLCNFIIRDPENIVRSMS